MAGINRLAEQLLVAVKTHQPLDGVVQELKTFGSLDFNRQLVDDKNKKAFWINAYNAFFQMLRKGKNLKRPQIFREKHISISGRQLSLDNIEHGILRRFRHKYSLGLLPNPFVSAWIRKHAVHAIDYRIHFALNCGAKSCPPIAFYRANRLEEQLELATASFIELDSRIDESRKEMHVTRLFKWYLRDFGGTKGVRRIISKHLDKDLSRYKLIYKDYSWEEHLDNYDEARFEQAAWH